MAPSSKRNDWSLCTWKLKRVWNLAHIILKSNKKTGGCHKESNSDNYMPRIKEKLFPILPQKFVFVVDTTYHMCLLRGVLHVWCAAFTATLNNEKFSGYQPCQMVKWRKNQSVKDHPCPRLQGIDQYPEDEDRDGPWKVVFFAMACSPKFFIIGVLHQHQKQRYGDCLLRHTVPFSRHLLI
jgi:hypothetical protein